MADVRSAESADIAPLAQLWHDAWQDAHADIVPAELARHRTLENFRLRLEAGLPRVRVTGPVGAPSGFCVVKGDELDQLFVARSARGQGVAAALIADAEARIAAHGFDTGWLACAIGNARAARFYEKQGWRRVGTMVARLAIPTGVFPLEVWRYEKRLGA
ncbi:acetyltransferase, GNAT family [Mizugakiibacter sediminis]|uniref:Acetyltransferase, GNAT family n=1 Tax=Mizugakiibacter sediminis TaxID=1475481 RepID=A0A0K8QNG0_9GAMM|nr:GNAT family N-acetyltransferase [Mizugakiibacter sediminis]GAP66445.1 acetyltransferase, GNAT family [Mizugakiibacter sediminis]